MTTRYLVDCDLEEMELAIPREHVEGLLDYFDGRHEGDRGVAEAVLDGSELRFEARGGRLMLELRAELFHVRDLEIMDDREGEFFERVVVNLFRAYRGLLRCRVRWAQARSGVRDEWLDVVIERGRSTWPSGAAGGWLVPAPAEQPQEQEALSADNADALEEVVAKLEEAERHFSEYLRLKSQRGLSKS